MEFNSFLSYEFSLGHGRKSFILKVGFYVVFETWLCVETSNYKGCSKSNASHLIMLPKPSELDAGGMAVEIEPFCQYSITFCCHVTDGSRGTV